MFVYGGSVGLLLIFIAQVVGIAVSGMNPSVPVYAYVGMAALFLCAVVVTRNKYVWLLLASSLSFVLSMGVFSPPSTSCADDVLAYTGNRKVAVSGWIAWSVAEYPDREKILLKTDSLDNGSHDGSRRGHDCLIQLFSFRKNNGAVHLLRGDYVRMVTRLRMPKNLNNPGSFDYRDSLAKNGIGLVAYVNNREDITIVPAMAEPGILRFIDGARLRIKDVIAKNTGDQTVSGIVTALVIGDQGYISRDIRRMFASTGIIHILVVAGLHLAIITHLFYLLTKFLLSRWAYLCVHTAIPKLALVISLVPMTAYIFLSGAHPPVVRSGIMIAVYGFLFLINKTQTRWTGILIAAIFILAVNPAAVYSISFQLSFVAVGSIIACMPVITTVVSAVSRRFEKHWAREIVRSLTGMLLVSFFVTTGLFGVIAFYFNTLPLFGILLNLIIIPFFCYLVLPLSLVSSAAGFVLPAVSHYLFMIVSLLVHGIVSVVSHVAGLSIASIRVPTPNMFEIFLYYGGMIVLLNFKSLGPKTAFSLLSLIFLLLTVDIGSFVAKTRFNKELRITFIDVGQGDSALIEFPYGKTMLIDAGGSAYSSYDTGEAVVARYLWSLKRTRIDYAVSSHPQEDHMAGLCFIIKNMGVKKVYKNDCSPDTAVYRAFMEAVRASGAAVSTITGTVETLSINGVGVTLFSIPHEACDPSFRKDINDDAVLAKITYKDVRVLFTGDIEKDAERTLAETYRNTLKSDIMKAAHHGSRTSTSAVFLDAVQPGIVVIPVGRDNRFRMPSKTVLRRLFRRNINVLRTDRCGAITITTDGKQIKIKRYIDI